MAWPSRTWQFHHVHDIICHIHDVTHHIHDITRHIHDYTSWWNFHHVHNIACHIHDITHQVTLHVTYIEIPLCTWHYTLRTWHYHQLHSITQNGNEVCKPKRFFKNMVPTYIVIAKGFNSTYVSSLITGRFKQFYYCGSCHKLIHWFGPIINFKYSLERS